MKISVPYSLKKGFVMLGMLMLPYAFGGCEKDPFGTKPENPDNPQNMYNIEYIYNRSFKFRRIDDTAVIHYSAFADTVAKYSTNKNVKKIKIIPENETIWATAQEAQMASRADKLHDIYNSSNAKLSGEGTTLVLASEAFYNQNVQNILHDLLNITLTQSEY